MRGVIKIYGNRDRFNFGWGVGVGPQQPTEIKIGTVKIDVSNGLKSIVEVHRLHRHVYPESV